MKKLWEELSYALERYDDIESYPCFTCPRLASCYQTYMPVMECEEFERYMTHDDACRHAQEVIRICNGRLD